MREPTNVVSREIFQVSLVTYLILTLAETLKPGYVSNFLNMNYVLGVVLVTGVAMVLTEPPQSSVGKVVTTVAKRLPKPLAKPPVDAIARNRRSVINLRDGEN